MKIFLPALLIVALPGLAVAAESPSGAAGHAVIALWGAGAPGAAGRRAEPEKVVGGSVSNIHFPTLTVYLPPAAEATGAGIVVCPGGGHRNLVMQKEGYDVAQWLSAHGIAAFVLKNRLANDDATPAGRPQPYTLERDALADARRALRVVRSRAEAWKVDPARVGIIGFSAGGELAALVARRPGEPDAQAVDVIDRLDARPAFQGLIYPGQSQKIEPQPGDPPAFLCCGADDRADISEGLAAVYLRFKKAGIPVELHIFSGVGHGFGLRPTSAATWPDRLRDWLVTEKFIPAAAAK